MSNRIYTEQQVKAMLHWAGVSNNQIAGVLKSYETKKVEPYIGDPGDETDRKEDRVQ